MSAELCISEKAAEATNTETSQLRESSNAHGETQSPYLLRIGCHFLTPA
jgi:hypothetical protein